MPQIKINGLNIEVATEGQGRDVVLAAADDHDGTHLQSS